MRMIQNKNMKWWVGTVSFVLLFLVIGIFSYQKMGFILKGVQITAHIDRTATSPLIHIKGAAPTAVYVSLNGREIFIDKDGTFTESIALLPGLGVITIDAQDKFGKMSEKKFEVMYHENTGVVALSNTRN